MKLCPRCWRMGHIGDAWFAITHQTGSHQFITMWRRSTLPPLGSVVTSAGSSVQRPMLWGRILADNIGRICELSINANLKYKIFYSSSLSAFEGQIRSKMSSYRDEDGLWKCLDCGYRTKNNSVLYEHIESRHVDHPGYECDICSKFCSTRNALRNHKSFKHRDSSNKLIR